MSEYQDYARVYSEVVDALNGSREGGAAVSISADAFKGFKDIAGASKFFDGLGAGSKALLEARKAGNVAAEADALDNISKNARELEKVSEGKIQLATQSKQFAQLGETSESLADYNRLTASNDAAEKAAQEAQKTRQAQAEQVKGQASEKPAKTADKPSETQTTKTRQTVVERPTVVRTGPGMARSAFGRVADVIGFTIAHPVQAILGTTILGEAVTHPITAFDLVTHPIDTITSLAANFHTAAVNPSATNPTPGNCAVSPTTEARAATADEIKNGAVCLMDKNGKPVLCRYDETKHQWIPDSNGVPIVAIDPKAKSEQPGLLQWAVDNMSEHPGIAAADIGGLAYLASCVTGEGKISNLLEDAAIVGFIVAAGIGLYSMFTQDTSPDHKPSMFQNLVHYAMS